MRLEENSQWLVIAALFLISGAFYLQWHWEELGKPFFETVAALMDMLLWPVVIVCGAALIYSILRRVSR